MERQRIANSVLHLPSAFQLSSRAAFPFPPAVTLDEAIDRLYDLNPGTTPLEEGSPHERRHKPLLLLAALDLIDEVVASID